MERREEEIERLGRLLEAGRPLESVYADTRKVSEERRLAQLNTQV